MFSHTTKNVPNSHAINQYPRKIYMIRSNNCEHTLHFVVVYCKPIVTTPCIAASIALESFDCPVKFRPELSKKKGALFKNFTYLVSLDLHKQLVIPFLMDGRASCIFFILLSNERHWCHRAVKCVTRLYASPRDFEFWEHRGPRDACKSP